MQPTGALTLALPVLVSPRGPTNVPWRLSTEHEPLRDAAFSSEQVADATRAHAQQRPAARRPAYVLRPLRRGGVAVGARRRIEREVLFGNNFLWKEDGIFGGGTFVLTLNLDILNFPFHSGEEPAAGDSDPSAVMAQEGHGWSGCSARR